MHPDYLEKILNAQVYDVAIETPLDLARTCRRASATGSAQARGHAAGVLLQAARRLQQDRQLSPEKLKRGVICASAGNHAQGVALSAAKVGCRAVIVMPTTTPQIKIDAVKRGRRSGAAGDSYDDAYATRWNWKRRRS
jgi:threonine dehydratase